MTDFSYKKMLLNREKCVVLSDVLDDGSEFNAFPVFFLSYYKMKYKK